MVCVVARGSVLNFSSGINHVMYHLIHCPLQAVAWPW